MATNPSDLEREMAERKLADTLEERVRERTAQLEEANRALSAEVAELKRAEQALRAGERRFRRMLEGVKDYAIFMLDCEGRVASWSPGAERAKGYRPDEIVGKHFARFYTPEDQQAGLPARALQIAAEQGRFETDGWRVRKDGSRFWANVVITAVHDEAGKLLGFVKVTRDVTRQKQAEDALKLTAAQLAESNADLEQFAYIASHDLQEPLRMVASYTQLLARRYQGQLDKSADEFIHFAVDGANRMQRLIDDLLTYSRVGASDLTLEPIDTDVLLAEVLDNLQVSIRETGAAVTREPLPRVVADRTQLAQLLQNLLSNAIKFHGQKPPKIHVGAQERPDEWMFSVRDEGIGFDPKFVDRIFLIFQRLHARSEYPGTGIGLALCKKIVERHGGRIWVDSQPGQGSVFRFTLPKAARPTDAREVAEFARIQSPK